MKRWVISLILVPAMVFPAVAGEDKKGDEKNATVEVAKQTDESPIQRLAELRLDEYVVPARMINLPIPGKTRMLGNMIKLPIWTH